MGKLLFGVLSLLEHSLCFVPSTLSFNLVKPAILKKNRTKPRTTKGESDKLTWQDG